jgi:hypothetical protein
MRNGQDCAFLEFFGNNSLDDGIVFHVYVCCRLVDKHYAALLEESSANAKQLFLSC